MPVRGARPAFSGISADGSPWQFCSRLGATSPSVRYLTEVGVPGSTLAERVQLSRARIAKLGQHLSFGDNFADETDRLFELLPTDRAGRGVGAGVWIAVALNHRGDSIVRLYANNGHGEEGDRWRRIANALRALRAQPFTRALQNLAPAIVPYFSPSGMALTWPAANNIFKLYMRPRTSPWRPLRQLSEMLYGKSGRSFLARVEYGFGANLEDIPPQALILSFGGARNESSLGMKLDFCGHCVFGSEQEARRATTDLSQVLERAEDQHARLLRLLEEPATGPRLPVTTAFVGVGVDQSEKIRLEVYLAPAMTANDAARTRKIPRPTGRARALRRGADYLLSKASQGGWRDYSLPVGESTSWVTAYVAHTLLASVVVPARQRQIDEACAAAAQQLLENLTGRPGWGYNEAVEPDADSTAYALLFLDQYDIAPLSTRAWLARHENPDGGYATYLAAAAAGPGWAISHPDVTPTVVRALYKQPPASPLKAIEATRTKQSTWNSYWWLTDLYATHANLAVIRKVPIDVEDTARTILAAPSPRRHFDLALYASALSCLPGPAAARGADFARRRLLQEQRSDGSWRPSAWLRITDPEILKPWRAPYASGHLYLDAGIFTTATVMAALESS